MEQIYITPPVNYYYYFLSAEEDNNAIVGYLEKKNLEKRQEKSYKFNNNKFIFLF